MGDSPPALGREAGDIAEPDDGGRVALPVAPVESHPE
jgi:hypothetical protein